MSRVVFLACRFLFADANQDDVTQEIASWCSSRGKRETPKVVWSIRAFDWFFGQMPSSLDCIQKEFVVNAYLHALFLEVEAII